MLTLAEIQKAVGGDLFGDGNIEITGVQSLDDAGPNDLAPFDDPNYLEAAKGSVAGALIVTPKLVGEFQRPRIVHEQPVAAMNIVIELLGLAEPKPEPGLHPTAIIHESATVPASCSIGPYVVIGPDVKLGERCIVHPHVTIQRGVQLGDDCRLDPGVVLHPGAELGNRVVIGTGAVIARQGFGFTAGPKGPVHIHHVGKVAIGDDTSIGAYCSIDRARFGTTRVGTMSGLDYGVHLGHNTRVGDRSYLAAQTGLAGHAFVGNDCEVGGQAGFANRAGVGDKSQVGAQSGLITDYGPGCKIWGSPAVDFKLSFKMQAALKRLVKSRRRKRD